MSLPNAAQTKLSLFRKSRQRAVASNRSKSRLRQFFAHFCLGHHFLYIERDRKKSLEHFRKGLEYGDCAQEAYIWAKSYHDLLAADDHWPSWIDAEPPR